MATTGDAGTYGEGADAFFRVNIDGTTDLINRFGAVIKADIGGGGGGGVTTFNGRNGAVTPTQADYDGFFLTPAEGNAAYEALSATIYYMPPPTGVVATDQAAVAAAFASPKNLVVFKHAGTYLLNSTITWPSNKKLLGLAGSNAVELKASDTATNTWMFESPNSVVTGLGAQDIVFNCNAVTRQSNGTANTRILNFTLGTPRPSKTLWRRCSFLDSGEATIFLAGNEHAFVECSFILARRTCIQLIGSADVTISQCRFEAYNTTASSPTYPAVQLVLDTGNIPCSNLIVTGCRFISTVSNGFSIEGPADVVDILHSIHVSNNIFDANNVGGSGISVAAKNSSVVHNKFLRGVNSNRCAYECNGKNNLFANNFIQMDANSGANAGSLVFVGPAAGSVHPNSSNHMVLNNVFEVTSSGATGISCITISNVTGFVVANNTMTFTLTGTASGGNTINLGGGQYVKNGLITNNCIQFLGGNDGAASGIRIVSAVATVGNYAKNIIVTNNRITGCVYGFRTNTSADDTDIIVKDNMFLGVTGSPIFGTASGAGNYIEAGTFYGRATVDPTSVASGANVTFTVTVTGADLGDYVDFNAPYSLQTLTATAYVSAANTVSIALHNHSGGAVDLASGVWKVVVTRQV